MKYFQNYVKFNEALDVEATNKKLMAIDDEIKSEKPNFKKILRKINNVISKSEIITDHDIQGHIKDIFNDMNAKLKGENKTEEFQKNNKYVILQNLVTAFDKNNEDEAKKQSEAALKLVEEQKKKDEEKKKKESEASAGTAGEAFSMSSNADHGDNAKVNDGDEVKKMFGGNVTADKAPQLSKNLVKMELPEVKAVQKFLMDRGMLQTSEATTADGYFGDKTAQGVMAYQKSKNLTPDGIIGVNTWKAILADVKFPINKDFKTYQINTGENGSAGNAAPQTGGGAFKINDAPVKPKMTVAQVVEILHNQNMNDNSARSDEDLITSTIIEQVANGSLNASTTDQMFNEFKKRTEHGDQNGFTNGLLITFDISKETLNGLLKNVVEYKKSDPKKFEDYTKYSEGMGENLQASLITMALFGTGSNVAAAEFKAKGIDVDALNTITKNA